jgi:hypothetical protein
MNNLFEAMTLPGSHENEYIMKGITIDNQNQNQKIPILT